MTDSLEPRGASGVREAWLALGVTLAATAAAMLVDRTVYQWLNAPTVYDRDLGRLLRVMGFGGTWIALALAVGLVHDDAGAARARRRGWLVFWSPMLAGAVAELLKLVVRRERPALHDGAYGFRAWDERTWSGAGLAFPSSHAAVAFGGAAMLARLFPCARWVGYALAVGCAATRVFARAHFVSDVVFAAGLGWLVSWALWRRFGQVAAAALLLAGLATPRTLTAQAAAPRAETCTMYRDCAYNLVPRGLGLAVVRGESEVHVATLGFLWPSSMAAAFAGDGEDAQLARRAVRVRWVAAALTDIGIVATALGAVRASRDGGADNTARATLAVGLVSLGASVPLQFKADGLLARAVWHYNTRFAR